MTGKCGSVLVRLIPAPRGTGIVSAPVPKKLLHMAGIDDCYTAACGQTATLGNFGRSLSIIYRVQQKSNPLSYLQILKQLFRFFDETLQLYYLFILLFNCQILLNYLEI